jgi:5'-3' exonuclease
VNAEQFFEKAQATATGTEYKRVKHTMLIDFSNILYSSYFTSNRNAKQDDRLALWRYFIFNMLMSIKAKFQPDEIVLALDNKSWRTAAFEYYKAKRKLLRKERVDDTEAFFDAARSFVEDLKCLPYKQVSFKGAEGDDVIAVLASHLTHVRDKITVVSVDKDLQQLQKFKNVQNYCPIKKIITKCDNPHEFLYDHIIQGDSGDGIPNLLAPDNIFLSEARQPRITKKKRQEMAELGMEEYCKKYDLVANYKRNRRLIELSEICIPKKVWEGVVYEYNNYELDFTNSFTKILGVFDKYNIRYLRDKVPQFMF